jgi:sugar phosphate isomerase/epimerase
MVHPGPRRRRVVAMTAFRLGINTCFAVKRWPAPEDWLTIVRELGLDLVQHSLDLVDLDTGPDDLASQASAVRAACQHGGVTLHSTFTGLAAYSANLLLHPDLARRDRAASWYRRAIDFTALAGAGSTGGHVGAYSVADWTDPGRREQLWRWLREALALLAGYARDAGLNYLMIENLAAAREPSTMAGIRSLLTAGDARHVPIVACLDVGHQCVPGATGAELDPYAWLSALGAHAPVVQLQQSDAAADHHWPFTPEANAAGRITAPQVLRAIEASGAAEVALVLEIIPPFEADDDQVLADLRASVEYWRRHLAEADGS